MQSSNKTKHIHILGIAGTFMANLAVLAKQSGYKVTGADQNIYPPMSDLLEKESIECLSSYELTANKDYLNNADCVVIGNALSRGNDCVEYVLDNKLCFKSGPAWLYENLLCDKWVLAVSGTHGKTTTTSLLATILDSNAKDPGFLIGGRANNFKDYARNTSSKYFVIEADEYDTAFFDKRPKFLHYFPNTLIINNIEYDHADIYPDLESIEQQFGYLLRTVSIKNGSIIAPYELYDKLNGSSQITKKAASKKGALKFHSKYFATFASKSELDNFKPHTKEILAAVLIQEDGSEFDCYYNNLLIARVKWECLGLHNVNNALAAVLAAQSIGIKLEDAIASVANFKGVARRLDKKAELKQANILIFDDFAHHPTAIQTTLHGLKQRFKNHKLTLVLDFSSYTMQHGVYSNQMIASSINLPDDVYLHQESNLKLDLTDIISRLHPHQKGYEFTDADQLIKQLSNNIKPNEVIIFMTKSGFNRSIKLLIDKLSVIYAEVVVI